MTSQYLLKWIVNQYHTRYDEKIFSTTKEVRDFIHLMINEGLWDICPYSIVVYEIPLNQWICYRNNIYEFILHEF